MERLFHTFSILAHFRLLSDSMTNSKPLRRRVRCEKCALTANLIKGVRNNGRYCNYFLSLFHVADDSDRFESYIWWDIIVRVLRHYAGEGQCGVEHVSASAWSYIGKGAALPDCFLYSRTWLTSFSMLSERMFLWFRAQTTRRHHKVQH